MIAVIHNNEPDRLQYLLPKLNNIVNNRGNVDLILWGRQPDFTKPALSHLLLKHLNYVRTKFKWNFYLEKRLSSTEIINRELRHIFHVLRQSERRKRFIHNSRLEDLVTEKHFEVFKKFLDSKASNLIVLENDAIFKPDIDFSKTIEEIEFLHSKFEAFIILGGGFTLEFMEVDHIESEDIFDNYLLHKKAFTNTALAYSITRSTASLFFSLYKAEKSGVLKLPIDWLLNAYLAKAWRLGKTIKGISFRNEPVLHGSMRADYSSWQSGTNA